MSRRERLDTLIHERGLAPSRSRARALVLAGQVTVDGIVVSKAGTPTSPDAEIALLSPDHPYVGRGGVKLAHAIDTFGITVTDAITLDVGASTGGFTEVLLQRGARRVVALDVGRGQLAWKLRQDPRVVVIEGVNARSLEPDMLPHDCRRFDVVTIDVAFISITLILARIPPLMAPDSHVVALVKPQFEAGRSEVGNRGVITDPDVHARVIKDVAAAADAIGLSRVAVSPSPITGAEGNQEFFLHLRQ